MNKVLVDIYTGQQNFAILKLPEREYPGVVFQGDSLSILCNDIERIYKLAAQSKNKELEEEILFIRNSLKEILEGYKLVLRENKIELPFKE